MDLYDKAVELRKQYSKTHNLVLGTRDFLQEHVNQKPYEPKSLLESRLTSGEEAFRKRMSSCGAMANMAAVMLRYLGLKVKLVHGEHRCSCDHAWLMVYVPERKSWVDYDLTSLGTKNGYITSKHKKKLICTNWEEIYPQLLTDHLSYKQR